MKDNNISHATFIVSIDGHSSIAELQDILGPRFGYHDIEVSPSTTVFEVTEEEVLDVLEQDNLLRTMTLEQRARAIEVVKQEFCTPEDATDIIRTILKQHFTHIVFGDE